MRVAFWDTETDGLLKGLTKMHCLGIVWDDGSVLSTANQPGYTQVRDGVQAVIDADLRVAHNGQDFDDRAVLKLFPTSDLSGPSLDTLLISRLIFPDIYKDGPNNHKLTPKMKMSHSLEAWGMRLGELKDDYSHRKKERLKEEHPEWTKEEIDTAVWATWDEAMSAYMMQDIFTLKRLFAYLMSLKPDPRAVALEHDFAAIIRDQEDRGVGFDHAEARAFLAELTEREAALEGELVETYGEWWMPANVKQFPTTRKVKRIDQPHVTMPRFGKGGKRLADYVGPPYEHQEKGATYTPIKRVQFNPGSREHVSRMLQERHGWIPQRHTKTGAPQVDDDVLRALPFPEAPMLADFFFVRKMKGNLETWLKNAVEVAPEEWRLFPTMNTCGAVTFRCTHRLVVNVPAAKKKPGQPEEKITYGRRCRSCFIPAPGYELCGWDASNLELVMLAHYVWKWDDGAYAKILNEGDKALGTDPHSWMRTEIIGEDLIGSGNEGRENAKTAIYAYIYGAGNEKLGAIVAPRGSKKEKLALGGRVKDRLLSRFEALGKLQQAVTSAVEDRGFLVGLDGRKLRVRKAHAAINALFQGGGAVCCKKALVCLDDDLQALGLRRPTDYGFVLNVHDEAQAEVLPEHVELYLQRAPLAVARAAVELGVKCPLKAEAGHGPNWSATH